MTTSFMKQAYRLAVLTFGVALAVPGVSPAQDAEGLRTACMAQLEQSHGKAISEDTRALCEDALAANPDAAAMMTALAAAYLRIGPLSRARELFLAAAERGDLDAMAGLGFIHMAGLGIDDYAQAFRWLRKPAAAGNADAQNMLGTLYEKGWGVAADDEEALRWYRRSAENGSAEAQARLGAIFYVGKIVERDFAEAHRWLLLAAEQGHAKSQNNLASLYMAGLGVEKNLAQGVRWIREAAAGGNADGQHNLGQLYEHGVGVTQNEDEALKWYRLAAAQGHEEAGEAVRRLEGKD